MLCNIFKNGNWRLPYPRDGAAVNSLLATRGQPCSAVEKMVQGAQILAWVIHLMRHYMAKILLSQFVP